MVLADHQTLPTAGRGVAVHSDITPIIMVLILRALGVLQVMSRADGHNEAEDIRVDSQDLNSSHLPNTPASPLNLMQVNL